MSSLIRLFLDICLLRRGPQDVPASVVLMQLCTVLYLATSFGLLVFDESPMWQNFTKVAIDFGIFRAIVWGALLWRDYTARWQQTWTALMGSCALLAIVAIPITQWLYLGADAGSVDPVAVLLWFGMLLWNLAVIGHVMRHALQTPLAFGVMVAVGYLLVSVTTIELLFPRVH